MILVFLLILYFLLHYNFLNQDSFVQTIIAEESYYLYDNLKLNKQRESSNDFHIYNNTNTVNSQNSLRLIEQENFFDFTRHEKSSFSMSEEQRNKLF